MSEQDLIQLTEHDDHIVQLTINRPEALNALNADVLAALHEHALKLAARPALSAVILTGAGRAFVAGADIKAMIEMSPEHALDFSTRGHQTMSAVAAIPAPVLAAVNGFALGGGLELALAADLIYGSTKAKVGLPEVGLGLIPGFGGTQRLARLIGPHAARELVFTGKMLDAQAARERGIFLEVFEPDALLEEVLKVARAIASKGPRAVHAAKRVMAAGLDESLSASLELEQNAFQHLFEQDEPREGMSAHLQKRAANFGAKKAGEPS